MPVGSDNEATATGNIAALIASMSGRPSRSRDPIRRGPTRNVVFLGIHHVDVLAASELRLHHGVIVAGHELVGDSLS